MKLLRNPVVVGVLVVVALVVVAIQFKPMVTPLVRRVWRSRSVAEVVTPAARAAEPAVASYQPTPDAGEAAISGFPSVASADLEPVLAIDRASAWTESVGWVESPRRDPFHGSVPKTRGDGPSAREKLRLHGVWRQTARTLAVINDRVLAEGDAILQWRVETIEQDAVWMLGPNGREKIEFTVPPPEEAAEGGEGAPGGGGGLEGQGVQPDEGQEGAEVAPGPGA